ncbi:hypothetical protein Nepgr_014234 [Nepenthes gracilis]|uniref:NAD(P)H-quinone oxidoreductase subunit U, chloroplastic n=1 Tax=Nepenthes gracilis TaxID=150966 RepID=A0AAD3SJ82_NEPGR|nr:hypothetical protein Nepgr_014234 [Nepenthes gracilis]
MAVLATTSAAAYAAHRPESPPPKPISRPFSVFNRMTFGTNPPRSVIRSSGSDDSPSAETGTAEKSTLEVPEDRYSLISSLNVEKALRGIAITDADHYGRLGIQRRCPYDQVPIAYMSKVEELKRQGLDEEELNKKLELLKESYTILSSEEERRLYDWSLARSETPDKFVWPFEVDITQTPTQTPPPQEPEDEGPTRVVGYVMLGWLVLAFTLSIVLNR